MDRFYNRWAQGDDTGCQRWKADRRGICRKGLVGNGCALCHIPYAEVALNDVALYEDIVNHRRKFYHVGYVDYDKELPQSIQIVPSDALLPSYEADYNEMRDSFIYGESLDFSALMKRMAELQERFRKMSNEL